MYKSIKRIVVGFLLVFFPQYGTSSAILDEADVNKFLGKQITLAIVKDNGPEAKPEIALYIGIFREENLHYLIEKSQGKRLVLPNKWVPKIKPLDDSIKEILGGSDALLAIPKEEFLAEGFSYTVPPGSTIEIVVSK